MRADRPGRRQRLQPLHQIACLQRRDRVGGAHSGQPERLVRRPELPDPIEPGRVERGLALQAQRRIGAVEHQQLALPKRIDLLLQAGMRLSERAGGLAGPDQAGIPLAVHPLQPPGPGRLGVVAISAFRQCVSCRISPGPEARMCYQRTDAEDEFARTARQQNTLRCDLVKGRQRLAQRVIARIGIVAGICRLHCRQGRRTGPAGIAVGRKVVPGHTQHIGATMQAFGFSHVPQSHSKPRTDRRPARPPA